MPQPSLSLWQVAKQSLDVEVLQWEATSSFYWLIHKPVKHGPCVLELTDGLVDEFKDGAPREFD